MTWAFIRKLLGRGRVLRSVGGTRAAGRARARTTIPIVTGSQPIVPAARPSMTIRSPVAPEPAAPDVVMEQLREGLARGLRMLDSGLDPAQRASDLVPFARELRTNPATAIRQLPLAAQRALAMLGDEASTASLALLFEKDPAITQSLLVRANSAYYNPTGKRVLSMRWWSRPGATWCAPRPWPAPSRRTSAWTAKRPSRWASSTTWASSSRSTASPRAERLDLAQVRHVPFDADEVWRSGGLNGSQAIARSLAEKVRPAKAS